MASRFWVGGTGTWDGSDTTHWAATSGGAGGQSVPGSGDTVTLDGSSGGGAITLNTNPTIISLTADNHTGTFDLSVNNNTLTISGNNPSFQYGGSATRTLTLGSATIVLTGTAAVFAISGTNITFSGASSVISFTSTAAGGRQFFGGSRAYGTINIGGNIVPTFTFFQAPSAITNLNLTAPYNVIFSAGSTFAITNMSQTGGSVTAWSLMSSTANGTAATISSANSATLNWAAIRDSTWSGGGTFAATNSADIANNTGITITAPSSGGPVGQQCQ